MRNITLTFLSFLFCFCFCLHAQQENGYFGVWHNSATEKKQIWQELDSFDDWADLTRNYGIAPDFAPVEFEEYSTGLNQKKYFGKWQDIGGKRWSWIWRSKFDEWQQAFEERNNDGLELVDFEIYDGNFFSIFNEGDARQTYFIESTLDAWLLFHNSFLSNGYHLVDFEKYGTNGLNFFIGIWEEGEEFQEVEVTNSLEELLVFNKIYENEGYILIDFEKYTYRGDVSYFGLWQEKSLQEQKIAIFNRLEEWGKFNQIVTNETDYLLADFEKFSDTMVKSTSNRKVIKDSSLIGNVSYSWSNDTIYTLEGSVQLETGGVLNIEKGTKIIAKEGACLTIAEGAQLFANGTKDLPIIFTIEDEPESDPFFPEGAFEYKGTWGGLTIKGIPNFNSGCLTYVSIRFAGQEESCTEGAGLTLWNVDKATKLDHIEVYVSDGDGVKINGGTAALSFISSTLIGDDAFEYDYGWTGSGIYWFGYPGNTEMGKGSHGIEGNSRIEDGELLFSNPTIHNVTLLGGGCVESEFGPSLIFDKAIVLKNNAGGTIANSLFTDFYSYGLEIEDLEGSKDSYHQLINGNIELSNNAWWGFGAGNQLDASVNGIIEVSTDAEDEDALFLSNHLLLNTNFFEGFGVSVNSNNGTNFFFTEDIIICLAIDPRLQFQSSYFSYPNKPYPITPFFNQLRPIKKLKGAFDEIVWLKDWTALDKFDQIGEEARSKFSLDGNRILENGDTIIINCTGLFNFHRRLRHEYKSAFPNCGGLPTQGMASARQGNRRRRPNTRNPEEGLAFIEDAIFNHPFAFGCKQEENLHLFLKVFDRVSPKIYPIPDENGKLTVFLEDCDEAFLTEIARDTQVISSPSHLAVTHTFFAQDWVGNQSNLSIREIINGERNFYYADLDEDGFGNPDLLLVTGSISIGFVTNAADCDDNNPSIQNCEEISEYDLCFNALEIIPDTGMACIWLGFTNSRPSISPVFKDKCLINSSLNDIWVRTTTTDGGAIEISIEDNYTPIGIGNVLGFQMHFIVEVYLNNCGKFEYLDCFSGASKLDFSLRDLNIPIGTEVYFRIMDISNITSHDFPFCIKIEPSLSTAIDEFESHNKVKIFPNPINNQETINIEIHSSKYQEINVAIFDIQGRQLKSKNKYSINGGNNQIPLNINNLTNGLYFVQISTSEGMVSKKLVVNK